MSFDLFKFFWEPAEGGCCLATGGEIANGGQPIVITVREVTGGDALDTALVGRFPLMMSVEAGEAIRYSKEITKESLDVHQESLRAFEYVASLELELGNALSRLEHTTAHASNLEAALAQPQQFDINTVPVWRRSKILQKISTLMPLSLKGFLHKIYDRIRKL